MGRVRRVRKEGLTGLRVRLSAAALTSPALDSIRALDCKATRPGSELGTGQRGSSLRPSSEQLAEEARWRATAGHWRPPSVCFWEI